MGFTPFRKAIEPDHAAINTYDLKIPGVVDLTAVEISGIKEELETVVLPDRTAASGGGIPPFDITVKIPMHHKVECSTLDFWWETCKSPALPGYKRPAMLMVNRASSIPAAIWHLSGVFVKGREGPALDQKSPGDLALVTYTLSVDGMIRLPGM